MHIQREKIEAIKSFIIKSKTDFHDLLRYALYIVEIR